MINRKNYGKDTQTIYAVRKCMALKLTDKQAEFHLRDLQIECSLSKYKRIKKWIRESPQERLDYIAHTEYTKYYIDAIDKMKYLTDDLISEYKSAEIHEKVKISKEIRDNLVILQNIYTGIRPDDSNNETQALEQEVTSRGNNPQLSECKF